MFLNYKPHSVQTTTGWCDDPWSTDFEVLGSLNPKFSALESHGSLNKHHITALHRENTAVAIGVVQSQLEAWK